MIDNADLIAAKTRFTQAAAEEKEIKIARLKGELLSRDEVNHAYSEKVNIIKNKLLSIPEIAPQLSAAKTSAGIKSVLKAKIYEILNELNKSDFGFMGASS